MSTLRPPLPPPLTHDGIAFIRGDAAGEISPTVLNSIASALSAALPQGDFEVSASGNLIFSLGELPSQWRNAGRLEGIDRSTR